MLERRPLSINTSSTASSCLDHIWGSPATSHDLPGTAIAWRNWKLADLEKLYRTPGCPTPRLPLKVACLGTGVSPPLRVTNIPGNSRGIWHSDIQCLNKQQKLEKLPGGMKSVGDTSSTTFDWLSLSVKISLLQWKFPDSAPTSLHCISL